MTGTLEEEKEKVERNLNYAKTIKLTGQLPSIPTEMGKMSCNDFQKYSLEKWNVFDMPNANSIQEITDTILYDSNMNIDLKHISSVVELINTAGTDYLLAEHVLPKEIVKKMDYGIYHPDIQLMIKLIYENSKKFYPNPNISAKQFSRDYVATYLVGDVAKLRKLSFSDQECIFMAEAIAVFGGYNNLNELFEEYK